jgi:hypothetical protein
MREPESSLCGAAERMDLTCIRLEFNRRLLVAQGLGPASY